MTRTPQHVIFGTGAIGLATLDALLRRGETVRMVNRSGHARVPDGVQVVAGDAADPQFTIDATRGAAGGVPNTQPAVRGVGRAVPRPAGRRARRRRSSRRPAGQHGERVHVRASGRPASRPRPATTRHTPRKASYAAAWLASCWPPTSAGRVSVAIGRASDYFGPRGGAQSNLGDRLFPAALNGKTASVLGDPDQPHTYTYIPDIGEGLAVLGEHPDAPGQVWHLPNDPDTRTTRQLVDVVFGLAGQPRTRLRQMPPLLLRLASLTNRTLRELLEMQYQFDEPFIVDSSKITTMLGVQATPLEQALADTLATYQPTTTAAPRR